MEKKKRYFLVLLFACSCMAINKPLDFDSEGKTNKEKIAYFRSFPNKKNINVYGNSVDVYTDFKGNFAIGTSSTHSTLSIDTDKPPEFAVAEMKTIFPHLISDHRGIRGDFLIIDASHHYKDTSSMLQTVTNYIFLIPGLLLFGLPPVFSTTGISENSLIIIDRSGKVVYRARASREESLYGNLYWIFYKEGEKRDGRNREIFRDFVRKIKTD